MEPYLDALIATLLVSLRIGPALMFAPPFTYLRTLAVIRVVLSFSLAAWLVLANPRGDLVAAIPENMLIPAAFSELLLGLTLTLCLQIAFAAILTVGRAIDFQVGFGLALLADPTLRTQMPLIGTLLAYAAGIVFFSTSGPADFLAIWSDSIGRIPVGAYATGSDIAVLLEYTSAVFVLAVGLGGLVLLTLFLVDIVIAFLSRTLPQMNVLLLGFQVKTITLLVTLPFVFSLSGALFLRILRLAIETTPRLL
jgi:flagellar biosynthetic protein FliR